VNDGLLVNPVHDEVTPLIVTLFAPVPGDKFPDAVIPLPVTEY
jgi:hypothetical protein